MSLSVASEIGGGTMNGVGGAQLPLEEFLK